MRRIRLAWQIYAAYVTLTLLALLAVGLFVSATVRGSFLAHAEAAVQNEVTLLEPAVLPLLAAGRMEELDRICKEIAHHSHSRITVVAPDGTVLADSAENPKAMENHADRPEIREAGKQPFGAAVRHSHTLNRQAIYIARALAAPDGRPLGFLRASEPLSDYQTELRAIHFHIAAGIGMVALLAAGVSLLLARRVTRPLQEMQEGAARIARGQFSVRVPDARTEEIHRLAGALNAMAAQLQERFETIARLENVRRDFVANVSHELRTPITSIQGFVETLQDGAADNPVDARRFLEIIARQAARLETIIADLLLLARLENEADRSVLAREECVLSDILHAAVQSCQKAAGDRRIRITLSCPPELRLRASPNLLQQAVVNLVDNAVKYSPEGTGIELRGVAAADGAASISVRDEGCGIAPEHQERIFERFYRVDKARSRESGGTGLGLAIVKHIVLAHDGRVAVTSAPGIGSTFTITLPPPAAGE
jgi:two-component system phosphate regulon sensor histidine kinase PhoR